MTFVGLMESNGRGELMLLDGGICRFRHRKDGQITIDVIISQKKGVGFKMLQKLQERTGVISLFAKCPQHLKSNEWYKKQKFTLETTERLRTGTIVNHWRLWLIKNPMGTIK